MKLVVRCFLQQPYKLFFLDACGALLTSALLMGILRPWEAFFGMPANILNWLAGIALLFAFYSFSCFILVKRRGHILLRIIATLNISYCLLTSFIVILHLNVLSGFGLAYFIAEIIVIAGLVHVEWRVANALNTI